MQDDRSRSKQNAGQSSSSRGEEGDNVSEKAGIKRTSSKVSPASETEVE